MSRWGDLGLGEEKEGSEWDRDGGKGTGKDEGEFSRILPHFILVEFRERFTVF